MARREFTKTVYAQIVKRAMHPKYGICCEGCGLVLGKKKFHVDHTIADGLQIDKSGKLTADDGILVARCGACGHEDQLDRRAIERRFGKNVILNALPSRLRCRPPCGNRIGNRLFLRKLAR